MTLLRTLAGTIYLLQEYGERVTLRNILFMWSYTKNILKEAGSE